jgi:hypothetical protein
MGRWWMPGWGLSSRAAQGNGQRNGGKPRTPARRSSPPTAGPVVAAGRRRSGRAGYAYACWSSWFASQRVSRRRPVRPRGSRWMPSALRMTTPWSLATGST